MDEMRRAAGNADVVALGDLAHRLKSSCRVIGAVTLGQCCERIECAGPACSMAQIHTLMAQMEDALAHVMARLSDNLGEPYPDTAF
jgi:HPt (histidine-containing phosphotransfer) domain-containing protein